MKKYIFMDSPIGRLGIAEDGTGICRIVFDHELQEFTDSVEMMEEETPLLLRAVIQLQEYFQGKRKIFDLPLSLNGTNFQKMVWKALLDIPYGQTKSYGEIAEYIGNSKASRAVGMANHRNPVPIIVPCHRVIGKDGKLVGYGGGLDIKIFLLNLEKRKEDVQIF